MPDPAICDYEGSDYQDSFWTQGGRQYEDQVEAIALRRLLPKSGRLLLEVGAGAGRNTPRYAGMQHIVLLDYSRTQLEQARAALGDSPRYTYVAADAYRLPFIESLFDVATMIRVLHHMEDAARALRQVSDVLGRGGTFILEFANKRNLKSILRYWMGRQTWNPFSQEPVEFARLNFDFHPAHVRRLLTDLGFRINRTLTVSHFRAGIVKRLLPTRVLTFLDSLLQYSGGLWQLTPSVFMQSRLGTAELGSAELSVEPVSIFKCPACKHRPLTVQPGALACGNCGRRWGFADGIYDFRSPLVSTAAPRSGS
jgi:ubiquinone/menaquinone biosynthesis C-methylase UbiE